MSQRKRILIIGAKGMAGHMIFTYLREADKYEMLKLSHADDALMAGDPERLACSPALPLLIESMGPDIVVNCAGILTSRAESKPDIAILVNSYLPHMLAKLGDRLHFKMIQFSTDCEFSGKRGGYTEKDVPDAQDIYGRTKAMGEVNRAPHLNLRTSFVGPEINADGIGLFHWFMHQSGEVKGYVNAIWTGVTTLQLAKSIEKAIDNNITGLYQLVNGEPISKFALLNLFKMFFAKDDVIIESFVGLSHSDKSLISSRSELPVPGYNQMLLELKEWMITHEKMYEKYFDRA